MLAYGCGDFASVLYWQTFMKYLPFFYTEVFGISAAALGTMLLFSRVLDGVTDPAIGLWADRTNTRWGKFRPFILFGALPFVVLGVLTFTTPNWGYTGKLVWAYATFNGLMLLYSVVNIPYTAMLGVMTTSPSERTRLSSVKFLFAFGAGLVVSASLLPLVRLLGDDGAHPQVGWQRAFIVIGVVACGFFLVTALGTRERVAPAANEHASLAHDVKLLFGNRPWLLLLATTFTWVIYVSLRSSVFAHFFKYTVYGGDVSRELPLFGVPLTFEGLVSAMNAGGQAAAVLSVFATASFSSRFEKRPLFVTCLGLSATATALYAIIPPSQVNALFLAEILGSVAGAPLPVLLWSMYADAADYGEWKYGRRTTGLVFSASTMGQKVGWALGPFVAFQLLNQVGFVANVPQTESVEDGLLMLVSLAPVGFALLSLGCFCLYPLDDATMRQISVALAARRPKSGSRATRSPFSAQS